MSRRDEGGVSPTTGIDEAPRDPGIASHHTSNAEDFEGHRAHSVYVGYPLPGSMQNKKRSRHRHKHHHHHHHRQNKPDEGPMEDPSTRVQFLLGEDADDSGVVVHPIFSEMETLVTIDGQYQWKETARWVKFEEDVEEGGERWSKPHVATLSLHALFELRSFLLKGVVMLDCDAQVLDQIAEIAIEQLVNKKQLEEENRELLKDVIMRKHRHLYERTTDKSNSVSRLPLIRSLAEIGRNHSSSKSTQPPHGAPSDVNLNTSPSGVSISRNQSGERLDTTASSATLATGRGNTNFMRKIPPGSEASNILVGEVNFLKRPIAVFIRLTEATFLGDLTEVPVPTRFIFIHMGPQGGLAHFHENGRAMATLFSDEVFHEVAYKATKNEHLLAGMDEFLDAVTVLPPGEWDPSIRIEPPALIPSQEQRKKPAKEVVEVDEVEEESKMREQAGLVRSGRFFGGFINDIKRKAPWYLSDFKDGLSMQSVATFFFLYFACLTPIITFGGLLGEATHNRIAAMESLVAGLICGVVYGFCSGQPLTILGSTGPVLVFETIVFDFCKRLEWDYLSFRLWIGLWCGVILITLVAVDASAAVCYITRFTEENFATLIAFIFIYKAVEKVAKIGSKYPMELHVDDYKPCICDPGAEWGDTVSGENITEEDCLKSFNGTMTGPGCAHYYPDVFLLSLILFIGTFLISKTLKDFKGATFFPTKVRTFISDFAVIIAILLMVGLDMLFGIHTPKLEVPAKFEPTWEGRGWLIPPFNGNPWWTSLVAVVPALLATILVFMDQQITAVIINRKEFKLKKGGGYHLDLFCVAVLIMINSVMGLPWFVAATVLSINHVNSLKQESECAAPGEKPQFLGVQENRVTHILIFIFIGLSVVMTPVLRAIPMPVLFGVFLYMGISALAGLQFFDRIMLLFMPVKYQPDYAFLRQVPLKKVHLFTLIQLICLAVLWIIKSFSQTSILFPIMLVVMIGIRKLLDFFFEQSELKILDDTLPDFSRKKRMIDEEDDEEKKDDDEPKGPKPDDDGMVTIPMANGNVMRVPVNPPINISEEMNNSGIWKGMDHNDGTTDTTARQRCLECDEERSKDRERRRRKSKKSREANGNVPNGRNNQENNDRNVMFTVNEHGDDTAIDMELTNIAKNRSKKNDAKNSAERRRLSMMTEEEEEEPEGITIKVTNT